MFCVSAVCIHSIENHFSFQLGVMFHLQTSLPPPGSHLGLIPRGECVTLCGTFHSPCVGASIGDLAKEVQEVLIENKGTCYCTFMHCTSRPSLLHRCPLFEPHLDSGLPEKVVILSEKYCLLQLSRCSGVPLCRGSVGLHSQQSNLPHI